MKHINPIKKDAPIRIVEQLNRAQAVGDKNTLTAADIITALHELETGRIRPPFWESVIVNPYNKQGQEVTFFTARRVFGRWYITGIHRGEFRRFTGKVIYKPRR